MPVKLKTTSQFTAVESENGTQFKSINLNSIPQPETIQLQDESPISGLVVNKDVIIDMVNTYRYNHATAGDPNYLRFIHFSLQEVIQLFIANEVIDSTVFTEDQLDAMGKYGLKIYLGNHTKINNCPDNNPAYLNKDTAILCNTLLTNNIWSDLLKDTVTVANSISISGAGEGLDRGSICPPNCPPHTDSNGNTFDDILTAP